MVRSNINALLLLSLIIWVLGPATAFAESRIKLGGIAVAVTKMSGGQNPIEFFENSEIDDQIVTKAFPDPCTWLRKCNFSLKDARKLLQKEKLDILLMMAPGKTKPVANNLDPSISKNQKPQPRLYILVAQDYDSNCHPDIQVTRAETSSPVSHVSKLLDQAFETALIVLQKHPNCRT